MNYFFETYECKIDDKGRVKLPSPLMKHLEKFSEDGLVIKRSVFENCLEVYPMKPWEKLMNKVNGLNRFIQKNADFIRKFTAGVKIVEVDSAERILIPKDLKLFAALNKEIVISGVGEYFEIWDKPSYEARIATNADDFSALTEEVMGSINFNEENEE